MNNYIQHIPGMIVSKGGVKENILGILGIEATPLDVANDGRCETVSALMINGKQYAIADILGSIAKQLSGGMSVKMYGTSIITADHAFAEMKAASPLSITWEGTPAIEVSYTEDDGEIVAIAAKFISFGETMTVTTITIASDAITKTSAEYVLTAPEVVETPDSEE